MCSGVEENKMTDNPRHGATKTCAIYGSLYLDQNPPESYEYMETQIAELVDAARKKHVTSDDRLYLLFDFVGTRDQAFIGVSKKGLAHQYTDRLFAYTEEHYPKLAYVGVGITDDDLRRPMRDIILTQKMLPSEVDGKHKHILERGQLPLTDE